MTRRRSGGCFGVTALLALLTPSVPAMSQEYCVACTGPDAVYRCVIEKAVPTGIPLKKLCVGTLVRQGSHAGCAVRGGTVFDCEGPVRRIDAKAAAEALSQPPAVAPQGPSARAKPGTGTGPAASPAVETAAPRPALGSPTAPPQEARPMAEGPAKHATRSAGEALGKAGDAIGGGTRKVWGCLSSFFASC